MTKRTQSSREGPAGVRSGLSREWRWRIGDRNPAGAMTQHFGGGGAGSDSPSTGANGEANICVIHALIYNKKHTHFSPEVGIYTFMYTDKDSFNCNMYTSPPSFSPPPFLDQRTSCPESYDCLSGEHLGTQREGRNKKLQSLGG